MKTMRNFATIALMAVTFVAMACTGVKKQEPGAPKSEPKQETTGEVVALTKADFLKKVYNYEASPKAWKFEGKRPVIIDFYATWCGPCKHMAPIIERIAKENAGKIDVYKVDVDQEQELASKFGIQSIPTFILIPVKGDPRPLQGAMSYEDIMGQIQQILLNGQK